MAAVASSSATRGREIHPGQRLDPGADRAIGAVNVVTGRGRHISSSAIALRLPDSTSSWVIDTPGVRSFGLSHVSRDRIIAAFDDQGHHRKMPSRLPAR